MLTQFAIQKAAPTDKPYKVFDGNGLFLLVKPNGKKLWRFRLSTATGPNRKRGRSSSKGRSKQCARS